MARHRGGRGLRGGRQANPRGSDGSGRDEANSSGADAGNRSGHHYDDNSSVGQSQPADQSQTRPPLAEEPAALLRNKVEAIGIHVRRAEPVFPPGPGYGAAGTPCVGRANRFLGRLVDEGLNQYNVTISPEPTPNGAYREVMTKLVSANQHTELGGRFPAYDGPDVLFTAGALPFNNNEFEVTLSAGGDKRKYKVPISILQLRMLLAGYPIDIPAQALQVLETVLRGVVFNERDDIECVPIGTNDHTLGVEEWKGRGLYQADVCSSVFVQPLLLIDFVQKILKIDVVDRNLAEPEYDKLLKALRDVKIEVTHRGNKHHRYRIAGLSVKPTNDLSSESPSGATKTVIDHFSERYSLEVKYKSLPCIDAGSEQKPIYLSIEVCKIVPRQCYQKNLECSQVSILRKSASIQPEPDQSSHQLEYHDSGSQKSWFPTNGYWNMKDKGIYGYPIEIQALFFMAMKCALSWLDSGTINDIYSYKTEEYSQIALSKFNVIPGSLSDCIFDFMRTHGGYFISNDGPALDFSWFCLCILIATLSSLATGEQAKALLHILDECRQRLIGEMPLKICYPATENQEWQIIAGCDPKNTRWSYNNEGLWPDAACAWEALKRSIVYLRGQPIGTVAAIHKSQGAELSDAQLGSHGFSPKQLMDIVQKMSVSNKVTIYLDKSENRSNDKFLKSYQAGIGAARLWCLKYGLQYDFSHIYGATVFAFTTPPGGTFYVTVEFEGRTITLLLAGRDLYIKGWRKESHESFEIRMENCSAYMLGNAKVMNIEKNYAFLCPGGEVGRTRIGPDALREAFNILYKCRGKRSSEVRRAIGVFAVNFPEAIRIQKVYKTVLGSFLSDQQVLDPTFLSDQQVLDPIPLAPEESTPDPQNTNSFWIENYGHYSHQAILDANARDSETGPPGIDNRDGANIESATEIFREIRVLLRDACPRGENETKPPKIEDPDDRINHSFISEPKNRAIKERRKGKVPDFEGGDGKSANAESIALFLLEDWFSEDEIDDDETYSEGDGEAENGKGSDSDAGYGELEEEDKQASKVDWVNFSAGKFLQRRMEEQVQNMRISQWFSNRLQKTERFSNRLQKTESFRQINQFNVEKATIKKFIAPKPNMFQPSNAVSLGQRLIHRVARCLRFL